MQKHCFVYHLEHKNVKLIARLGIFRHNCIFVFEFFKQAVAKAVAKPAQHLVMQMQIFLCL